MDMKRKILFLRASYWIGIVADAIVGVRMLIPKMMGETGFTYAMGTSAALMFGWTVLLFWADRKPVERKGILLITIFPVMTGLMAAVAWPVMEGIFTVETKTPIWILGVAIMTFMAFSYFLARDLKQP